MNLDKLFLLYTKLF